MRPSIAELLGDVAVDEFRGMASTRAVAISTEKPNYGLDAPTFQRGAFFGGLAGLVAGLLLQLLGPARSGWVQSLGRTLFGPGCAFVLTAAVMFWGSKVGKLRLRDKMIASVMWRGDEHVLDVGCGHGMMLIAAAKKLTTGDAIGVDIWSQADQADNSPEATMKNARLEGVEERVKVQSADARELPFSDGEFDVVVSSFAIHNIDDADGRQKAIREVARVLKPGGQLVLADIRHTAEYAKVLRSAGWVEVRRWSPNFLFVTPTRVLRAAKS